MVISMVSIKVSIMVSIKVRQNINKMKWMNHISALRDFLLTIKICRESRTNRISHFYIGSLF